MSQNSADAVDPGQPATDDLFRQLVAGTPAAVAVVVDGTLVYVNSAAEQLVGATSGAVDGRHVLDFIHPEAADDLRRQLQSTGDDPVPTSFDTVLLRTDGTEVQVSSLATPVRWGGQEAIGLISWDITARARREAELAHAATHDPLTGLANRTLLLDRLELAMARIGRSCRGVLVLLLDLDGFKTINDTYGHSAGDQILRQVAERLRGALRAGDTVARLSGDEFVICADLEELEPLARVLQARVQGAVNGPYEVDGASIALNAGIGSIVVTEAADPLAVIAEADRLMYVQKRPGSAR